MYFLQQLVNALSTGGVYALIAVGFALIYSILKFSNWSHGAVIMLSSFFGFAVATQLHLPFILTLLLTTLAGGVIAVLIERIAFRQIRLKNGPLIYFFVTSITVSTGAQFLMYATIGGNFYRWPDLIGTTSISISSSGEVTTNGASGSQSFRVQLVRFANPSGLDSIGRNLFRETTASGAAELGNPGENGFGELAQGYLEMSNVKVVEEMVNMIVAQRAYEVNAKAVQASDEMMQMSNNLHRG